MLSHLDYRPALWYFLVVSLACTGAVNGNMMVNTMKMFGQSENWKEMSCAAACSFPFICVLLIFCIDVLEYAEQAEEEIDISTSFAAFFLWIVICIPATFLGASRAMVTDDYKYIIKPNAIPRAIPQD